ncbi:MAG: eukaryotic-like serine/threonine-protein kinase [Acidobacteriota bacterium]|jgi:serine/threonine protein kinase/formylglycine-generating enzyme required for sulfatase activity|nr:eukaryotic-like serine/threonine-protein kinase [Acidobacteriota bacterium]
MKECPACHRCFQDRINHCPSDGDRLNFLINLDTTLDERYLLERKLGQGGMGLVFKAQHKFIKTQHAIKVILPDLVGNDPSLVARFRQEAMAAAAIRHPNTVSVTDYGILNGTTPYLVMEFVEGRSLHELLFEEKRLSPAVAVEIMLAVCAGVAAAHRQGIVHRDLKPLNIMLRQGVPPGESLKVLDFGLAKIKSGELLGSFVAAQTQGMMGSPFYMAPEQWSDDDIDVRADIYSLGVILYQMIAGDVPFKGKSVPSIMSAHLNTAPVPLSERGIEVPPLLERAIQHALEKDPEKRPQSVEEFASELREALPQLNGVPLRVPGAMTVQIGHPDTAGLNAQQGQTTGGAQTDSPESLKTIASTPDALSTGALEGEAERPNSAAVAEFPESHADNQPAPSGSDTAHHSPAQTIGQFGAFDAPSTQHFSHEAPTEPLSPDTARLAEEERERREAQKRQRLEAEERELKRLEAEARAHRETEARARREAEEQIREAEAQRQRAAEEEQRREAEQRNQRELEERARHESEERARRESEERAAVGSGAAGALGEAGAYAGASKGIAPPRVGAATDLNAPARSPNVLPVAVGVAVLLALLAAVGVVGFLLLRKSGTSNTNVAANVNAVANANVAANANANEGKTVGSSRADLLWIPGGSFQMGRSDVPPVTDELKARRASYLLWMYSQWPAHDTTVGAFAIDRTEVTNGEYAEFVKETGHAPPPGVWEGNQPGPGMERLPVSNVTFEDAKEFAAWRSHRDGVTYRLPTEEEWEFAARGGDSSRMYPWGAEWSAGYANLGGAGPAPVGSFPLGRTPQGLDDMIGNVWEWTASEASMYKGNDRTALAPEDRGKVVARGGSYKSRPDGDEPVTVTARRWLPREFRDPVLGFRLVRAEP